MKDFSKEITEKIKEEKVVPDSRLKVNLKNYIFWAIFSCMILLGALFFSLVILNVTDLGPELFRYLDLRNFFFLIFLTMPYLWIFLLAVTIFSGFMVFRKTKRGYRYSLLFITGIIVLAISVLGVLAHVSKIDSRIGRAVPGPDSLIRPMEERWQNPDEGLLGGEIFEVGDDVFFLKNPRGDEWRIFYDGKTEIKGDVKLEVGSKVGIIGEKSDDDSLDAFVIIKLPFRDGGFKDKLRRGGAGPCEADNCHNFDMPMIPSMR